MAFHYHHVARANIGSERCVRASIAEISAQDVIDTIRATLEASRYGIQQVPDIEPGLESPAPSLL